MPIGQPNSGLESPPHAPPQIQPNSNPSPTGNESFPEIGDSPPVSGRSSCDYGRTYSTPATGAQTPDPLLGNVSVLDKQALKVSQTIKSLGHHGEDGHELETLGHRLTNRKPSVSRNRDEADESASPTRKKQGIPPELPSFMAEIILVMVCSAGLMLFSFFLGDMLAPQEQIKRALGITNTQLPWIVGAFNTANGLSVVISGSLSDLAPPKSLMVGAFAWLAVWNVVGAFSLQPSRYILFLS
ncbi:hypothetical protein N7462_004775 [Penicillium macrosclerotiorum]|uniref:uncharacterized protein n=1 Tax=Penicillium macrosclerotiorum TaxID=303699 RepID=UPI0025468DA8|nr:uncharacterized protein N7462_004775 [Penicillium macrosclerotiorum]KAJ5690383.1 hypothetical protein N7462_004775 [Penicillium macrosclerotiorum]